MSAVLQQVQRCFRPMRETDVRRVVAIEREAYEYPWSEGVFRDCLRVGYNCWVYEIEQVVEAYGIMSIAAGESHVLNLCVSVAWQGQRLGRELLGGLLGVALEHRAQTALLEVRPSNRRALRLYEGMGFSEVGMRRGYYPARQGREDALLLALDLAGAPLPGVG